MTYICLALVAALALTVSLLAGLLRTQARAHARREDLLLNQLLNLAGKPWQPAPADELTAHLVADPYEMPDWSATPEQLPVY